MKLFASLMCGTLNVEQRRLIIFRIFYLIKSSNWLSFLLLLDDGRKNVLPGHLDWNFQRKLLIHCMEMSESVLQFFFVFTGPSGQHWAGEVRQHSLPGTDHQEDQEHGDHVSRGQLLFISVSIVKESLRPVRSGLTVRYVYYFASMSAPFFY